MWYGDNPTYARNGGDGDGDGGTIVNVNIRQVNIFLRLRTTDRSSVNWLIMKLAIDILYVDRRWLQLISIHLCVSITLQEINGLICLEIEHTLTERSIYCRKNKSVPLPETHFFFDLIKCSMLLFALCRLVAAAVYAHNNPLRKNAKCCRRQYTLHTDRGCSLFAWR